MEAEDGGIRAREASDSSRRRLSVVLTMSLAATADMLWRHAK
jgi:hypothetical protein